MIEDGQDSWRSISSLVRNALAILGVVCCVLLIATWLLLENYNIELIPRVESASATTAPCGSCKLAPQ